MSENKDRLFELAFRERYRFESTRGLLTVEELWTIPLDGTGGLDAIAVALHNAIQQSPTTSFVKKNTSVDKHLQNRFDIVKYIIEVRIAERDAKAVKAEKDSQRRLLREAIAAKQSQELLSGSAEDLQKRLEALDD